MRIKKLDLHNLRNIMVESFALGPSFCVVVGQNGTGKLTLLHVMQVVTGAFFLGLPYVKRRHIQKDEMRFAINMKTFEMNEKLNSEALLDQERTDW